MRPVIHLLTREYPFGTGEAFVADEATRLREMADVVVVPAFATKGNRRALPDGVELDSSLADRPLVSGRSALAIPGILRGTLQDLGRRPAWPMRPRAVHAMAGYAIRGARSAAWARGLVARSGDALRVLSTWSNAEAFGLALAAAHDPRIRLVCRTHGFDVDERVYPGGHLPFRDLIAASSLALGPISENGAALLRRRHPTDADRIVVARLGVDPPAGSEVASRDPAGTLRVAVTCSRDHPVKRLELVADALVAAQGGDPDHRWTWLHIGGGASGLERRLAGIANAPSLVAPGMVPRDRIFELFREHRPDVFVNLSSSEGVPVTIMEALSVGIPVVATDAGGTGELVDDGVGRLLPVSVDAATAGSAIVEVADRGRALRGAAVERWRERASGATASEGLARLITPLLGAD